MSTKGISKSKVIEISKLKNEPKWMRDFRVNSYNTFSELANPSFGPELNVDFDDTQEDKKDISIVYRGKPGEFVQEAAFGDISVNLPSFCGFLT